LELPKVADGVDKSVDFSTDAAFQKLIRFLPAGGSPQELADAAK
jgi:hypothetical protein